jgi:hypothetical protein
MSGNIIVPGNLEALADRIRDRLQRHVRDMVAIGADLIAAKDKLGHRNFGPWLEREFRLTARSAQLYMRAAEWAEGKSGIISHLPPYAIHLLSAPTTPEPIRKEVVEAIRAGSDVDFQEVGERIRHKRAVLLETRRKEERKRARLLGKSPEYQKRLAREMEREEAAHQRQVQERHRLIDEAKSILQKLPAADLTRLQAISSKLRWVYLDEVVEGLESETEPAAPEPIEEVVEGTQPELVEPVLASTPSPSSPTSDIDELRAWAQTIGLDRLAKHVAAVPGFEGKAPMAQIEAFLAGKLGSYHLRGALETVRADLSDYLTGATGAILDEGESR